MFAPISAMTQKILNQIRDAVLAGRYTMSEHAYDEMDNDDLDGLDVEAALLSGRIERALTRDPRGTRYVVVGTACDESTSVAVVVRFVEREHLLIITVYERE